MRDIWQDLRFAARSLRTSPGFTAVAVLVLALGIGAGTGMFSVLNALLLRPPPVSAPDRLVVMWAAAAARSSERLPIAYRDLRAFAEGSRTLDAAAGVAYYGTAEQVLVDNGRAITAAATWVTGDLLTVMGAVPALGRLILPADDEPGAAPVMVISHGFWQRHFGGASSAVGHAFERNGSRATVVGVLPRGFDFPQGADVWLPVLPDYPATLAADAHPASIMVFDLVGRVAAGSSAAEVKQEFDAYLRAGDAERPDALRGTTGVAVPLQELRAGEIRTTVWAAVGAVALLLLIACVNVANLLLVRGSARGQELAIRSALGAGRGRLVRQLLTESALLAAAGGVLGVLLAFGAVDLISRHAPPGLPRRDLLTVDGPVLAFALVVTACTVILAGLLPALVAARGSGRFHGGRTVGSGRTLSRLRHGLVIGQISLAIVVVVAAGLLVRSLLVLQSLDMGFDEERLLVMQTALPPGAVPERAQRVLLQEQMLERVGAIPGVERVAALPVRPFSGQGGWTAMYTGEGQSSDEQARNAWINFEVVEPNYFATLAVPLRRGRGFTAQDREDAPPVAVISEAVARTTWPGADPLGKRIRLGGPAGEGAWHTVVGVVGETRYRDLTQPPPSLYLPTRQFGGPVPMTLAMRTSLASLTVIPEVRRALQEVHPDLLLAGGGSVAELMAEPLSRPRFGSLVLSGLAGLTLILAMVGVYGALAATVRQRRREMGIRMALGAGRGEVRALVLGQGMRLTLVGVVVGSAGALAVSRALRSMLFGVGPNDPATFAAVALIVFATSAAACYLPAQRASHVEPAAALKAD